MTNIRGDIDSGFFDLVPDSIFLSWLGDTIDIKEKFYNFNFRLSKSTHQSIPTTKELLNKIAGACSDTLKSNTLVLLSSGKDSVGLLLGYAESGCNVDCLSVVSDAEEEEWIAKTVRHLGHKVSFVRPNDILRRLDTSEIDLHPNLGVCYDQAIVIMDAALAIYGISNGTNIVDGMGNDIYFGHIPSKNQLRSAYYGSLLAPLKSIMAGLSFFLRRPYEAHGLATASSFIFKNPRASRKNLLDELKYKSDQENIVDYRAFIRGGLIDNYVYAEKTRILAKKYCCTASFPWMHEGLSNYVFNLPNNFKFDFSALTNKILLRNLLGEKINYSRPKRGIDLFGSIDISRLLSLGIARGIPDGIKNRITYHSFLPKNHKKRALVECALYFGYLGRIGVTNKHLVDFI